MLDATVTATVEDGGVAIGLVVRNAGSDPVECSFRDGQRIEAVAECEDGAERENDAEVWRYGDDRMFPMALGTETVPPGGEVAFDATWPDPEPGEYRIRAWLTATDADASAETRVSID